MPAFTALQLERIARSIFTAAGANGGGPRGQVSFYHLKKQPRSRVFTDALGGVQNWAFNTVGDVTTYTMADNTTMTYQYDALHRRTSQTDPLNRTESWAYNAVGNVTAHTRADGTQTTFGYDNANRLIQTTAADNGIAQFEYDLVGRLKRLIDARNNAREWTYDAVGRKTQETDPLLRRRLWNYDNVGNVLTFTRKDNVIICYNYL
jgi:YD repeat-containing protein